MTSDEFFLFNQNNFDIIFINGFIEANQVYRDIENSLRWLSCNGAILVHGCMELQANCDSWKAIVASRLREDIDIATIDIDGGISLIKRRARGKSLSSFWVKYLSRNPISMLTYDHLNNFREELLNVVTVDQFKSWLRLSSKENFETCDRVSCDHKQSQRGLIIPILERYENVFLESLNILYDSLNFTLPIELWQIGDEISVVAKQRLQQLQKNHCIQFKNVKDYTNEFSLWQGYQIKAFIMKYTSFDEVILADCDIYFYENPEIIFYDKDYKETGTYFFQDYAAHTPNNFSHLYRTNKFVRNMMPYRKQFFPDEWDFVYSNFFNSSVHMWFYMESGVVFMNRKRHLDVIDTIYNINYNWKFTYKYLFGDKETFWLAFVIKNKPFTMNRFPADNYIIDSSKPTASKKNYSLGHLYEGFLFFSQKAFIKLL